MVGVGTGVAWFVRGGVGPTRAVGCGENMVRAVRSSRERTEQVGEWDGESEVEGRVMGRVGQSEAEWSGLVRKRFETESQKRNGVGWASADCRLRSGWSRTGKARRDGLGSVVGWRGLVGTGAERVVRDGTVRSELSRIVGCGASWFELAGLVRRGAGQG